MERFRGKCLVRRAKSNDGKEVLLICGIFVPTEDIENYDVGDEVWIADFALMGYKKNTFPKDYPLSPEDFLEDTATAFVMSQPKEST